MAIPSDPFERASFARMLRPAFVLSVGEDLVARQWPDWAAGPWAEPVQAAAAAGLILLLSPLVVRLAWPTHPMPAVFQWIGALLPLTHFLKVLRGILLKGVGVPELWREIAILLSIATLLIALSVRRFQKTLD